MRTDREIIRSALLAGIAWEQSRREAKAGLKNIVDRNIEEFTRLLDKKYGGPPRTPSQDLRPSASTTWGENKSSQGVYR